MTSSRFAISVYRNCGQTCSCRWRKIQVSGETSSQVGVGVETSVYMPPEAILDPDGFSDELDVFVQRCLEKDRALGFASFTKVELERIRVQLGELPVRDERFASIPDWERDFMRAYTLKEFGGFKEANAAFQPVVAS